MKCVILAGGLGSRLVEETVTRPKPMVEIGGLPILWHIMKIYGEHGFTDFIICLGYKSEVIKDFFFNYSLRNSDVTIALSAGTVEVRKRQTENWTVTLIDTGAASMTGGRIKAIQPYLGDEEIFAMTYGDGVGDIDLTAQKAFHASHRKLATVTAVTPPGRFGVMDVTGNQVRGFREKVASDQYRVNAGYFLLSQQVMAMIEGAHTVWETGPMVELTERGELMAYDHGGFWQPMDTLKDKLLLDELWSSGKPPWKIWKDTE
jgi:glucose-1-phosphate cytidylyltransferase